MAAIPDKYLDLLKDKKAFASLATVMAAASHAGLVRLHQRRHPREHREGQGEVAQGSRASN